MVHILKKYIKTHKLSIYFYDIQKFPIYENDLKLKKNHPLHTFTFKKIKKKFYILYMCVVYSKQTSYIEKSIFLSQTQIGNENDKNV